MFQIPRTYIGGVVPSVNVVEQHARQVGTVRALYGHHEDRQTQVGGEVQLLHQGLGRGTARTVVRPAVRQADTETHIETRSTRGEPTASAVLRSVSSSESTLTHGDSFPTMSVFQSGQSKRRDSALQDWTQHCQHCSKKRAV